MNETEEVVVEDDDDDDDDVDDNHVDHQSRWQRQQQQQGHGHQYHQQQQQPQQQQQQHYYNPHHHHNYHPHAHPTTTTASRQQQEAMQHLFESMSFDQQRNGDQGGGRQQQQRQKQRYPTQHYSPATTVHDDDDDDNDDAIHVEEENYKTNHHVNDNNTNINLSRHTKTNHQQPPQQFQSSRHSHQHHHRQHFRSDSNAADDEDEANRNDDHDDDSSDSSDDDDDSASSSSSSSSNSSSSFDSNNPNPMKDGKNHHHHHHHHRSNNNSQEDNDHNHHDDNNDDDHSASAAASASSSSSIKSYLDAGYSNEEDYLFDQYGGVGGSAEERSELATALAHTLNVGPMADELFYEEVAMCFLRCRERHRMRVRREERRRNKNKNKMGEKKKKKMKKNKNNSEKKKKKEKNVSKRMDNVDEKKENGTDRGVPQGKRGEGRGGGGIEMDGMRERVAVEAVEAAMKMRASGGNGGERVPTFSAASTTTAEGGGGGGGRRFSRRSSLASREIFDEYDDSDDPKEDDTTTLLRERMSRMNVHHPHPRRNSRGGVSGVSTAFPSATTTAPTAATTPTATGVESEYEPGGLNDTEDDDDDDSLSRISDSLRNSCNVESDYEDVQRHRYRRRNSRGRKDEKVETEEDGGVQDEDSSMPSTPMSSADEKDEEDSFMNGQKFNDAKLFHTMSGVSGGGRQNNNGPPDKRIATPTSTNRVQAEMEHDDGDEIAFDNMTRDSDDDDGSNVGHIHGHPKDPMFQQHQHKPEPLFRVDLKSGGPPAGGGVAARNLKKGYTKKGGGGGGGGGGGSNRFPPPPPPRPGVVGGALGGNVLDPVQQQHAQQQQQQQQYQAQPPSPMDVDDEQKPPWEEKMARAARAAAEASALKNDHESLRRDFSMGVPAAGPTNNTKNNDGRKIGAATGGGGGGMGGRKHRSALSSGSGAMGQPGMDGGGGGGAEFSSKRHDVTRMSLHDDVKLMCGDDDDEDSLKNQHVAHLRDEGRTFYINGAYHDSVVCYTEAISLRSTHYHDSKNDAILAALYGNRAAALMMTGAYEGASADCKRALLCTDANSVDAYESLESGPAFRSKILCRMARALLKAGDIWDAEKAFNNSVQSAKEALVMVGHQSQSGAGAASLGGVEGAEESRGMEKILNQSITDATLGLSDVRRYRDAVDSANSMETSTGVSSAADRRSSVHLLMSINSALSISPGSIELHERKVNVLASLKRWAELANHCERFAAESVKFDGLFSDDLASLNPFPDVRPAHSLKADFFEKNPDDLLDPASMRILSPKAVCEAVVRMPNGILPTYLRSLRLEERYTEAAKAGSSIEAHMSETKHRGSRGNVSITWLSTERDKLRRTMSWKEMGDTLFRSGDYERAGEKYAQCLTIDNELTYNHTLLVNENAGGRLHAVLHCNRAACLMALKKYREAVKECTAALRIHTHYMKAMLRRGRCFARIRQYEEAIAEYERYIQLVIEARKSPQSATNSNAACTFDRPMDITEAEYNKAKQELVEVKKSMRNAAAQEQAQEKKQREQQFNFNKNFKAAANDAARRRQEAPPPRESAFTRKKQWEATGVNQRPWDTFDGTSPKKMNAKTKPSTREPPMSFHPSTAGGANGAKKYPKSTARDANRPYQQPQQKQQHQQQPRHQQQQQQQPPPPISKPTDAGDHYQVLGLLPTATATEIKKAYHKMALKYHPDKNSEEDAADIFRRVKLAYEVLGNDQSRAAYDTLRRGGRR